MVVSNGKAEHSLISARIFQTFYFAVSCSLFDIFKGYHECYFQQNDNNLSLRRNENCLFDIISVDTVSELFVGLVSEIEIV